MQPEGHDFQKNKIFEVLTLCGSNRFKIFLIVSEKSHFWNITFLGNAPDLSILSENWARSGVFPWKGIFQNSVSLKPLEFF